jgi:hypothetical protein
MRNIGSVVRLQGNAVVRTIRPMRIRWSGNRALVFNNDALRHPIDAMRGRPDQSTVQLQPRAAAVGLPPRRAPPPTLTVDNTGPNLVDAFEFEMQLQQAAEAAKANSAAARHRATVDALAKLPRIEDFPAPKQAPQQMMSPSLTAKFGCEIEVPSVDVSVPEGAQPPGRGTVLLERPHWKLETDNNGPGKFDLEAVFNPLSSEQQVRGAMKEIVTVFQSLRDKALEGNTKVVPLKAIAPDAKGDYTLTVNDIRFGGRLQSTYGIKLEQLDTAMEELLPRPQVNKIRRDTQAVADSYAALYPGEQLPPGARQFVLLVNMYLARAQATKQTDGTVHVNFRMMSRSDFCSAYEKLLIPADRAAVKSLLTTAPDQSLPPFMLALGLNDPRQPVFAKPYRHKEPEATRQVGPTVKAWLQSIVDGRGKGLFRKDLMSPPPGYPLHTGDLSKDYGMGAMGVDETNGQLLIEWRGAPYRPENVPMNGQIVRAVRNELGHAAALNETLDVTQRGAVQSAKFDLLNRAESAYDGFQSLATALASRGSTLTANNWTMLARGLQAQLNDLAPLRQAVSGRTNSAWAPVLAERIDGVGAACRELLRAGARWTSNAEVMTKLLAFQTAVAAFEAALWDAGKKTN